MLSICFEAVKFIPKQFLFGVTADLYTSCFLLFKFTTVQPFSYCVLLFEFITFPDQS